MFENRHEALLPTPQFLRRLINSILMGLLLIAFGLVVGMVGYRVFENMSWTDAFANAAMILSGMGPFGPLSTKAGKIFAGFYALFSGLAFIVTIAVIFSPVAHRFMHKFHLEEK